MAMVKKKSASKENKELRAAEKEKAKAGKAGQEKAKADSKASAKSAGGKAKIGPGMAETGANAAGAKAEIKEVKAKKGESTGPIIEVAKDIRGIEEQVKDLEILKYPLVTEKAVNMIETENKIIFIVGANETKQTVKRAVENLYKVKVNAVNIIKDMQSRKRAIVGIDRKFRASDIATKLGVI